jgi:hypothetical protein
MVRPSVNRGFSYGKERTQADKRAGIRDRRKYVGDNSPLGDVSDRIADACRECGVPLNDRAVLALTNRLEAAIAPVLDDLRTLAASCLSQDETPGGANVRNRIGRTRR